MLNKASAKVQVKDLGWKAIKKRFEDMGKSWTTVGVHNDTGNVPDSSLSMAHLAAIHEWGVDITITDKMRAYLHAVLAIHVKAATTQIHIPERAPIRGWIAEAQPVLKKVTDGIVKKILNEKITPQQGIGQLGEFAVSGIKARMEKGLEPGLNENTIRLREHGGTKPLINTGGLLGAYGHKEVFGRKPEGI